MAGQERPADGADTEAVLAAALEAAFAAMGVDLRLPPVTEPKTED